MKKTSKISIVIFVCILIFYLTPAAKASNALLKLGSRGSSVTFVQQLLIEKDYLNHEATGYYGPLTTQAVMMFQNNYNLKADGIVGPQTYKALIQTQSIASSSNSSNVQKPDKGEYLDWFKEVQYIFPIGTAATITDIDTGLSFKVMRTFGHQHADCETLTIEDTAVLKTIWGGWSWERRAVILTVGNRHIAASCIGMPHAGKDNYPALKTVASRSGGYGRGTNLDKIKNNGMDGHICIHFKNSTLHKNNKPGAEHQKMVKKAAGLL